MRDLILLFVHVLATSIRLVRPGGVRSVLAESVLLKHQLVILNRSRRAPNLRASDRLIAGLCALLVLPKRLVRSAVVVKPSTLLNFHRALVHRKYRLLFSPKHRAKPGPKGPSPDLIRAVIEMKQRVVGELLNLAQFLPRSKGVAKIIRFIPLLSVNKRENRNDAKSDHVRQYNARTRRFPFLALVHTPGFQATAGV